MDGDLPQPKSRTVFVLLALTFGFGGVHNFYARYWWRGAAQLAICALSMGIGSILTSLWAMAEAAMVTEDADGVPFYVKVGKPRYRSTYVWLAILLGWLGIHNFYARRWERGVLQLFLSVFGFCCTTILPLLMIEPDSTSYRILTHLVWFSVVWAWLEAWLIDTDGRGNPLESRFPDFTKTPPPDAF